MQLEIYKHRKGLSRLMKAIQNGNVTLGFIGGSITDSITGNRWPEYVTAWFVEKYPEVRFIVENAAIGATSSDLGVLRAERDLIDRGCHIVFVEYAVNDMDMTTERRMRTREGLVRKLLAEERDLVILYTYMKDMYDDMMNGRVPDTIAEFEKLAEHYGIGSVWMGLYALEEIKKGRMKWEEWLPDGIHPDYRGSLSYAQSVINYLDKELLVSPNESEIPSGTSLPAPLDTQNWEKTKLIPFSDIKLEGPWYIKRWTPTAWIGQILYTSAPGARISFKFNGRGLALGFDFGRNACEFKYRIDDREWIVTDRERPWWLADQGWFKLEVLADELESREHIIVIEVVHGNKELDTHKGTNFRLGLVGVIE